MTKTYFDPINKIWSGEKVPTIYNSNVSVGYLILNILENTPAEITQISDDSGIELTCRQMYQRTISVAKFLQKIDCKEGDMVGILALNSDNLAPAVFACLTLGLPISFQAPFFLENELTFNYSTTKPKLIFCDADIVEKMESVVKNLKYAIRIFTVDKKVNGYEFVGDIVDDNFDSQRFIFPHFDPNSLAIIMASSGTTSVSKQICKTHKGLIEEFTVQWKSAISSQEVWFGFSGNHWQAGILTLFMGTMYGGKRVITTKAFTPNLMLQIFEKYSVTTTVSNPMILPTLFDCNSKPITSMKFLFVGGIRATTEMCERSKLLFPNADICHGYSTTETGVLAINLANTKYESVGQVFGNVRMKILDDERLPLGIGEIGEIVYQSPSIFPGYFDNPDKTNEVIRDGWVSSGDMGYFDEEGFLFITDRKSDLLKYDMNISASALESLISEIADVRMVCVVGVYREDIGKDWIFAFVVKKSDSDLTEKYVEDYVSDRVEAAKKIRGGVHFVDSFPMTMTAKIRRGEVRNWAQEKYAKSKAL